MLRLLAITSIFSKVLADPPVPPSAGILGFRSYRCPFKAVPEISLESIDIVYDTKAPAYSPSQENEYICTLTVDLDYDPFKYNVYITDIEYSGDAEADIKTEMAWKDLYGPVRFTPVSLAAADNEPRHATNTTSCISSGCTGLGTKPTFTIQTRVKGTLGEQIKQSLKLYWGDLCVDFPCQEAGDVTGVPPDWCGF